MSLTLGTRLGPYEVLSLLGKGGMGEVYKAKDTRLGRIVAIKVLTQANAPESTPRILSEARAVARLNHPNIAALYDVVESDFGPCLVMEYVDGEKLDAVVARGECDVARAIALTMQLLDALGYAHREGVIHRDVKPANIALTREGQIKLLDLGIAQTTSVDAEALTVTSAGASEAGRAGTLAYMAPERFDGRTDSARSDLYSVGVVLYELLTSRRPYDVTSEVQLGMALARGDAPRVSERRPGVPPALDAIVARALARDPAERYASALACRDDLAQLQSAMNTSGSGVSRTAAAVTPAPRTRGRRAVWVTSAAIVALVAFGGWWWSQRPLFTARGPARVAILPVLNASEDATVESLGASLGSTLSDNLAAIPGVTIVSADPASYRGAGRDVQKAVAALTSGYLVDVKLRKSGAQFVVDGQLLRVGRDTPVWSEHAEGDALDVHRRVVERVMAALGQDGAWPSREFARVGGQLHNAPTSDAAALTSYLGARALLDGFGGSSNPSQSIPIFDAAVARDSAFAVAHAGLALAWAAVYQTAPSAERANALEHATASAKRALDLDPSRAVVHVAMARADQFAKRVEDAERHAREAVRIAPDDDGAQRVLANVLYARPDVPGAIAAATTAVRLRPTAYTNQYTLGYYLYAAGRYQDAVAPLTRATELRPESADAFNQLGVTYNRLGDIQQAIGNYAQAVRISKDAKAFSNLGTAYYAAGQFEDALASYQQAIRLNAASPTTHRNAADALERLHRMPEARREYGAALTLVEADLKATPANPQARLALGAYCKAKLGRINDALQDSAAAVTMSRHTDNDVMFKSAVIEALAGHADRALEDLEQALALGYPAAFARDDWDLRSLRELPKFKTLISQKIH